jgi:FMN phosphatase YigB (HAD superfamily)
MSKYIFDFDDVLFYNSNMFKKHMYDYFLQFGIDKDTVKKYYTLEKERGFVSYNLVKAVLEGEGNVIVSAKALNEMIMSKVPECLNNELIDKIKILGRDNCFMVTHGVPEYQLYKVWRSGIYVYFKEIYVIQDTKKYSVEAVSKQYKDEDVYFIDDKESRFKDLDLEENKNLKTVLFVDNNSIAVII